MKDLSLARASHCVGEANFHLQLTPAYRCPIFGRPKVKALVMAYILAKAASLGVVITAINFGPDHAHIFVQNCRKYSASRLVQEIKGFTSYMMRKNHHRLFSDMLWGDKFWTGGYFYRSVGRVTGQTVAYYIEHCQRKHWEVIDEEYYAYSKSQLSLDKFN
jgi:putative transposase